MRNGQAALEFLMTYGWAILAIVIVGAALFALGFFSPQIFASGKACLGFSSLSYVDHAFANDGNLTVQLGSARDDICVTGVVLELKDGTTVTATAVTGTQGDCGVGEVMIEANDKATITATGGSLTGQDVGDTYTGAKLTVTYDVIDGITGHTDTATCNGKFE
jgi:hypothetical protein